MLISKARQKVAHRLCPERGSAPARAGLSFPMFAGGIDSAPGGLAVVGECGPELVNLPRGSQVIPNDKIGGGAIHIDASDNRAISVGSGASPESVKQLQSLFEQDRRDRANQIVQVVRKAKQTRQL
jgi:hypothetical protein